MREVTRRKIADEIAAGRLWRAKEILQGNIASAGYDTELYEAYGKLLLELGDAMEAGKYLFLSGVRREDYEDAIELFLSRHERRNWQHLFRSFPAGARRGTVDAFPDTVAAEFAERAIDPARHVKPSRSTSVPTEFADRLVGIGCAVCIVLLVSLAVLGFKSVVGFFVR